MSKAGSAAKVKLNSFDDLFGSSIRSEKDILKLVNTIIVNTKGEGQQSGEDFWVSATCSQAVESLRTVRFY